MLLSRLVTITAGLVLTATLAGVAATQPATTKQSTNGQSNNGVILDGTTVPPKVDPCCPPWNSNVLQHSMVYQGSGSIADPYTLKFQPSATLNTQMLAYLTYMNTMNAGITSITITFSLLQDGNGTSYGGGTLMQGPIAVTWSLPSNSPTPTLFAATPAMVVNKWYRVATIIAVNGHNTFFDAKCAENWMDIRIQVVPSVRMVQMRFRDGRVIDRRISAVNPG